MISNNKKGFSSFNAIILSCIFSIITFFMAYYFETIKPVTDISITSLISIDYILESSIIMQMQQYKNNIADNPKSFTKEIMPNIYMTVNYTNNQSSDYIFEVSVRGKNFYKQIKVKGDNNHPDKLIYLN